MWASRCRVCGLWPAPVICAGCERRFAFTDNRCSTCALPCPAGAAQCGACLREPPALHRCVAALDYAYPWSQLVRRYKFGAEPAWASYLARRLAHTAGAAALLATADRACPIPLTRQGLVVRGYDQAWELLKALPLPAHCPRQPDLLLKLGHLPEQHRLDRAQRLRNALVAFAIHPAHHASVKGQRILLVDDVMTTGATLNAAAQLLRQAGAVEVNALVLARTPA